MSPSCPQPTVGAQVAFTKMSTISENEKAVKIAVSLLKHKSPQTVQTLKDLLTFIPNPNHVKEVLTSAVIKLVHHCPQSALWLFQHPEVLAPEIQVREIIIQELTQKLYAWGYTSDDFYFTDDDQLEVDNATKYSLYAEPANSAETAAMVLIRALLKPEFSSS